MLSNSFDFGFTADQLTPGEGWHCSHCFYSIERVALAELAKRKRDKGKRQLVGLFESNMANLPHRVQTGLVVGHKADFSLMMMDPDPIKLESLHQRLMASALGPALKPVFSYNSISEVSEYVPSEAQYAERLQREGEDPNSSPFQTKIKLYAERLAKMNYQRLTPDFPDWPVSCFYPMNKCRVPAANWFMLSSSERHDLMSAHARSGIKFAGRVSQLITVGIGLDDWEWGVTLWATNPQFLKQIVYEMRFDEASAKYAEFGPFYTSYRASMAMILEACGV
jgi:chlorite dismutase